MESRRLICPDVRRIEVETFDVGRVPEDGILVENAYTAVSAGTEVYGWVHGGEPGRKATFPRATGYCSAGTVVEVGSRVRDIGPGDRVAGQGNHAAHAILTGFYQKVPDGVSTRAAAFMVMGAIALHGVRIARIELGESVVVIGLGVVGQLAGTLAKLSGGMPLIAADLDESRLRKAEARGMDVCLNPGTTVDLPEAVRAHCPEDGANVVIEATGSPEVYPTAVKLACLAGRVVALGSPRGTVEMDFLSEVHLREVSILGAHQPKTPDGDHIYYRWAKDRERALVMRLMRDGLLPVEDLITHVADPSECQEVYTMLADRLRNALGVLFAWQGDRE